MRMPVSRHALFVFAALAAASISLRAQSPASPAPKTVRQAGEGLDDAAHGGWTAGPDRQLDQRHLHAARTARHSWNEGVLHTGRGRRCREGAGRAVQRPGCRRPPLRQRDLAERKLQQGPVEPAHIARHRSAGRTHSGAHRRGAAPPPAATGGQPRSPHGQLPGSHARRAVHHLGERRPADHARRLQRQPRYFPGSLVMSSCGRR